MQRLRPYARSTAGRLKRTPRPEKMQKAATCLPDLIYLFSQAHGPLPQTRSPQPSGKPNLALWLILHQWNVSQSDASNFHFILLALRKTGCPEHPHSPLPVRLCQRPTIAMQTRVMGHVGERRPSDCVQRTWVTTWSRAAPAAWTLGDIT